MERMTYTLRVLLLLLTTLGGVVAAIWLLVLGQWWAVGYGFGALLAPFMLTLLAIPGMYFAKPALGLVDKGKPTLGFAMLVTGRLWEWAVFAVWFAFVFYAFLSRTTTEDYRPLLIWAWCMALGPWLFMAQQLRRRETGGDNVRISILSAHIAYLLVAVVALAGWFAPLAIMLLFAAITLIGTLAGAGVSMYWLKTVAQRQHQ